MLITFNIQFGGIMKDRDYIFHEATISMCPECMETIRAKIIIKDGAVYIKKNCIKHGEQLELLEEDAEYHLRKRYYDKPGTPCKTQTIVKDGCPFDCGLCPEHDQHSCIALIEVTQNCDLKCNVCYADSDKGDFLSLEKIEQMMDFWKDSEYGNAEILQFSGGEPTTHPQIIEIIKMARLKEFKYIMLNTNGLRIANDEDFVFELSKFSGGFEVYLQFDGFRNQTHNYFRGKDLMQVKKKAIDNLTKYKIPTTLVCTVEKGINDDEVGQIVEYGVNTKYIRGINFQPISYLGRIHKTNIHDRITLSGIINKIEKQTNGMILKDDFIPLPCNVERVAITYLFKTEKGFIPITRNSKINKYIPFVSNTFLFNVEDMLKESTDGLIFGMCKCMNFLKDFNKFIPLNFMSKSKEDRIKYVDENTFRISISSFLDAYNFDIKSMQKECVHVITEDLRKIPFSAYNLIHRKECEKNR